MRWYKIEAFVSRGFKYRVSPKWDFRVLQIFAFIDLMKNSD